MATVNQQSMRQKIEQIKSEFDKLSASKKINVETRMLFQSLFMIVNLLVSIFLEKTTKKNNKNSSKPSSQTDKDESALGQHKSQGKGKSERNTTADNTRTVETTTIAQVTHCDVCGADLSKAPCQGHERRTTIDILFEKRVEHVDAEIKRCVQCDSTVKAEFPSSMQGPLQYGNGLKAYVINLLIGQMIALNRVQKLIKCMMGEMIAESSLLKFVLRLYEALESWEVSAIKKILKSPAMNVDETGLRVVQQNQWVHVYSAGDITLKFLHPKRGTKAIEDINIIPRYSGTLIHDCWSPYLTYKNCNHGLCGSHLLRELQFVIDSNQYAWSVNMRRLLLEACKGVSKRKAKKLSANAYANLQKRYRNILTRAEKEMPIIPEKPNGKRGKIAKSDAHNLCERFNKYESAVLLFAKNAEVSFTNNRAERDLRMTKVKLKVSGCFRTELYAKAFCRISSYLQTMANKGHNPLVAIQMALSREFT